MFRECENKHFFLETHSFYNPQFSTFYFMFSTVKKHKQQLCLNPLLGHCFGHNCIIRVARWIGESLMLYLAKWCLWQHLVKQSDNEGAFDIPCLMLNIILVLLNKKMLWMQISDNNSTWRPLSIVLVLLRSWGKNVRYKVSIYCIYLATISLSWFHIF